MISEWEKNEGAGSLCESKKIHVFAQNLQLAFINSVTPPPCLRTVGLETGVWFWSTISPGNQSLNSFPSPL